MKSRREAVWFDDVAQWRAWLQEHHDREGEIWLGLSKAHVEGGVAYADAIDEALCFGWIDGITHGVDADGFTVRFTPRSARSPWSAVNIGKMTELIATGRVHPAGLEAFERRDPLPYPVDENGHPAFDEEMRDRLGGDAAALAWFQAASPSYRRQAIAWVMGAKRQETRERRMTSLIEASAGGRKVRELS